MRIIKWLLRRFYNEKVESLSARILYFNNTLDSYFLTCTLITLIVLSFFQVGITFSLINLIIIFLVILISFILFKIADFHPLFILLNFPIFFYLMLFISGSGMALLVSVLYFVIIQILFMGIPDSIVARDPKVCLIKIYNSLFTIAPTTVSFVVSFFFSSYLILLGLYFIQLNLSHNIYPFSLIILLLSFSLVTRFFLPIPFQSKNGKYPAQQKSLFKRVLLLNIDGCRLDIWEKLDPPNIKKLMEEGSYFPDGVQTIYRALTNPAFASILTGTIPKEHGIINNNYGQKIKVQGLPDLVPTKLYGSMHVKHFSKPTWDTYIVSLPTYSIYDSDQVMVNKLKEDILSSPEILLFIVDFSEADFLAHAYGSTSKPYREALLHIDEKIGRLIEWLSEKKLLEETLVIISSDHGIVGIDHSYLLFDSEKYVPLVFWGKGIKVSNELCFQASIMDICPTIAYILGVDYPDSCHGRALIEILENIDSEKIKANFVRKVNQIAYDYEAETYTNFHPEVFEGDTPWWQEQLLKYGKNKRLRILDYGSGTGLIADVIKPLNLDVEVLVCFDLSSRMLSKINRENYPFTIELINSIDELLSKPNEFFDFITINSVLHHVYDPRSLTRMLLPLLKKEGYVMGAHEPNKDFFKSKRAYYLARLFLFMEGGIKFPLESQQLLIEKLNKELGNKVFNKIYEVKQIVEYHSPTDQFENDISKNIGFQLENNDFFKRYFSECQLILLERYSTFSKRKILLMIPFMQRILDFSFRLFFGKNNGNLFRYIVKKV